MRTWGIVLAAVLLAGCAHREEVALFAGEGGGETGAVAVLDPKTGREIGVVDRANSRAGVSARSVSARSDTAGTSDARYAPLLATLPEPPRRFTLYFREGSTELVAESRAQLPELLAEIRRRPGADVEIVGHTDTIGQQRDNDALSLGRAMEMAELLSGIGLDVSITRTAGRGERELKTQTADEVRLPINRRVELFIR